MGILEKIKDYLDMKEEEAKPRCDKCPHHYLIGYDNPSVYCRYDNKHENIAREGSNLLKERASKCPYYKQNNWVCPKCGHFDNHRSPDFPVELDENWNYETENYSKWKCRKCEYVWQRY